MNVVDFEPGGGSPAVRALMLPLCEQIILDLCFKQGALLILLPLNLWILQESHVEAHHLLRDSTNRTPTRKPLDPGEQVEYTTQ